MVEQIFLRWKKAGFTFELKKKAISYGRVYSPWTCDWKRNHKTGLSKLKAVEIYPVPTTKKDVRSFLRLTGYYRRFIPNYATIAKSLTDLTQKSVPERIPWNVMCQEAFQILQQTLLTTSVRYLSFRLMLLR